MIKSAGRVVESMGESVNGWIHQIFSTFGYGFTAASAMCATVHSFENTVKSTDGHPFSHKESNKQLDKYSVGRCFAQIAVWALLLLSIYSISVLPAGASIPLSIFFFLTLCWTEFIWLHGQKPVSNGEIELPPVPVTPPPATNEGQEGERSHTDPLSMNRFTLPTTYLLDSPRENTNSQALTQRIRHQIEQGTVLRDSPEVIDKTPWIKDASVETVDRRRLLSRPISSRSVLDDLLKKIEE